MKDLIISKKRVLEAYNKNRDFVGFRAQLEELFGADIFSEKITDRVKTLEDAFEETGRPATPEFNDVPEDMRDWFKALYNGAVYIEALNEGWKADYTNGNERKWFPWFNVSLSGFAFRDALFGYSAPTAGYAARLCLKSCDLAEYAGNNITDVYEKIIKK
ncbi:MAG: hypothetical protein LBQ73_07175 [Tannerellaceae bacterium]|jgi:hypothetical protein|nr:hypothetical protein [Tannerellaceae bacterium]